MKTGDEHPSISLPLVALMPFNNGLASQGFDSPHIFRGSYRDNLPELILLRPCRNYSALCKGL